MIFCIDTKWLAGFFDGEGCVSIYRFRGRPKLQISIAQKDPSILWLIKEAYPEAVGPSTCGDPKKQVWHLFLNGVNAKRFLEDIRDFSFCKRSQIEMALKYISLILPANARKHGLPAENLAERELLWAQAKQAKVVVQ
jgi:hypothetical protein